jgi:hypothetical protein
MSLKYIHLAFMTMAIIVTVFFAMWAIESSLPIAIAAFAASVVEAEYARRFYRKAKSL